MIAGTRSIAPLIAGLTLSHLSYPAVASIQVQHCPHLNVPFTFQQYILGASFPFSGCSPPDLHCGPGPKQLMFTTLYLVTIFLH